MQAVRSLPRAVSIAVLAAAVLASAAARAQLPVPAHAVIDSLREIARDPSPPAAYARFLAVLPALDALAPPERARWLERLAAAPAPVLAARARLESLAHRDASPEALAAAARGLGFVDRWLVLGPDPAGDALAAQTTLLAGPPPEPGAAPLPVPDRVWEHHPGFAPPGAISVEPWLSREVPTTAHLATTFTCAAPTRATLRLGATGDLAAALDGAPLGLARGLASPVPDQLEVDLDLVPGPHTLLVSVSATAAARATLYARFTDRAGRPLTTLAPAPPSPAAWTRHAAMQHGKTIVYSSALARLSRAAASSPRAAIDAAVLRRALGLPDDGDASEAHGELLEDLLLGAPSGLSASARLLALAQVPREEARTSILLHWAATGPADPALRLALAQLAAERGQLLRARELLAAASGAEPATLALVRARVDHLDGLPETAYTTLLDRHGAPAAGASERDLVEAARSALAVDRPEVASRILDALAAALPGQVEHRAASAQAALAAGRPSDAVAAYAAIAVRRPDLPGYSLEAARLAVGAGRPAEGRALLAAVSPRLRWSPDLLDAAARLHEELGERDLAVAAFERSLLLRPASPDTRAALERLRAGVPEPSPLTTRLTPALLAAPPIDPGADFEVLADEAVLDLHPDGSAVRHVARLLRVQRVPDERDERTLTIAYDPSRELVRVLDARVHRGPLAIANPAREDRAVGEAWYGTYYDQRELAIPFDDLRPGDVIAASWRVDAVGQLFPGVFGDLEVFAPRFPTHTLTRTVHAPASLRLVTRLDLPPGAPAPDVVERRERLADGTDRVTLVARALAAAPREPHGPGRVEVAPVWQLTTFQGWPELVAWYARLLDEQRVITPAMRAFVADSVASAAAPTGVSRPRLEAALARAVTRDVRYVALEFGVHGFKPYRTDEVWSRRFGDCKDQSNLLAALLEVAGSRARVALVRTRGLGRVPNPLPSLALFDHAIVWLADRDLFLDPTAAAYGLGELPAADQGAQVLVIDPAVTELSRTPVDRDAANGLEGHYSVSLHPDGAAGIQGTVTLRGVQAPDYRQLLSDPDSRDAQLERVLNGRYPGLRLERVTLSDPADTSRPLDVAFVAEAPQVAARVGATLQVPRPAGGDGQAERLAGPGTRRQPLVLGPPSRNDTSFHYELPRGWEPRDLPPDREAQGPFGSFEVRWTRDVGLVHVRSVLTLATDQVAAADYPAFRAFVQAFDAAVRPPLVLVEAAASGDRAGPGGDPKAPAAPRTTASDDRRHDALQHPGADAAPEEP